MVLIEELLLWKHGCSPFPPEIAWAKEKWSYPAAVVERIEQYHGSSRDSKGIMCALLGACLIQAQNRKSDSDRLAKDNSKKQGEIDCLKVELRREKEQTRLLERKIEIMLAQAKKPPSITEIRKLITGTDPEDWDGDIWGDSDENSSEEVEELEERDVRPLIKTERHMGPHGGSPQTTIRTTPWSGPELSELQAKFSRKPGETKTEYLWRVSLTGEIGYC
ncbi:uncharacterized protein ACIBXB_006102 [Morphnus guianensis]